MDIQLTQMNVLRAIAALAPKVDVRPYLKGVWCENSPKGLILWATDGSVIGALRVGDMAPCESFNHFLPLPAIAALPKTRGLVELRVDSELALKLGGTEVSVDREGFAPPDWRSIMPRSVTHEAACFDVRPLAKFATIAEALGVKKEVSGQVHVAYNGQGTARVFILGHPEFVGAASPLRAHRIALPDDQPFNPEWIH